MNVVRIGMSGVVLVSLVGCSMFGNTSKHLDYAAEAKSIPPLEVPPDLSRPATDDHYQIPVGAVATSSASASLGQVPSVIATAASADSSRSGNPAASAVAATSATPVNAVEPAGLASLREISGGNTVIVMNDPFDRSWRKVGLALESAGLVVEDRDREKGIYYLRPVKLDRSWLDKLMFWKSSEDKTRHYRVIVKDGGSTCEVSITDQTGESNKVSKQMLEAINKNINQQQ
ncbi:MAG: outer membrane protein assembly factor BamC [Gallionella sp.]